MLSKTHIFFLFPLLLIVVITNKLSASELYIKNNSDKSIFANSEKVFVKLDNCVYSSGEFLYYTAFIVDASSLKKEIQSSKIYFELLNHQGKRYLIWKADATSGFSAGKMKLPDSISTGIYVLRAYTNWMRNFGQEFYYKTNILITKLSDEPTNYLNVNYPYSTVPDNIEVVVDGNHLIANEECTIGIRCNKLSPDLQITEGKLVNQYDSMITFFRTDAYGLAQIRFTPRINDVYSLIIDGKKINLPVPTESGLKVHIAKSNKGIDVSLRNIKNGYAYNHMRFIAYVRGKTIIDSVIFLNNSSLINLPENCLSTGIIYFKILNNYSETVYEKLFYYSSEKSNTISIQALDSISLSQKVAAFNVNYNSDIPSDSAFISILVRKKCPFWFVDNFQSAVPYLTFFSELSIIHNLPSVSNTFSDDWANQLLLTTPIKSYFWWQSEKKNTVNIKYLPENNFQYITGSISNIHNSKKITNRTILLSYPDTVPSLKYIFTDSLGQFTFPLTSRYDNKTLHFILLPEKNDTLLVNWQIDAKNDIANLTHYGRISLSSSEQTWLNNFRELKLVERIYSNTTEIESSLLQKNSIEYSGFQLVADYTIHPADYSSLDDFKDMVDNILIGIRYKSNSDNIYFYAFEPKSGSVWTQPCLIFLNGIPVFDHDYISSLSSKDIYKIEVSLWRVFYGNLTFDGIISIITNDLKTPNTFMSSNNLTIQNQILSNLPIEKIIPESVISQENYKIPVFNNVLYLNQLCSLHKQSNKNFKFLVPDIAGEYFIDIQGITKNETIISKRKNFVIY